MLRKSLINLKKHISFNYFNKLYFLNIINIHNKIGDIDK